jgi:hypothetical protein
LYSPSAAELELDELDCEDPPPHALNASMATTAMHARPNTRTLDTFPLNISLPYYSKLQI